MLLVVIFNVQLFDQTGAAVLVHTGFSFPLFRGGSSYCIPEAHRSRGWIKRTLLAVSASDSDFCGVCRTVGRVLVDITASDAAMALGSVALSSLYHI